MGGTSPSRGRSRPQRPRRPAFGHLTLSPRPAGPFGARGEVRHCLGFQTEVRAGGGSQGVSSKQPGSSPVPSSPPTLGAAVG